MELKFKDWSNFKVSSYSNLQKYVFMQKSQFNNIFQICNIALKSFSIKIYLIIT